jgi:hypothetical protein
MCNMITKIYYLSHACLQKLHESDIYNFILRETYFLLQEVLDSGTFSIQGKHHLRAIVIFQKDREVYVSSCWP